MPLAAPPTTFAIEPFGFGSETLGTLGFGSLLSTPLRLCCLPLSAIPPATPASPAPTASAGTFALSTTFCTVDCWFERDELRLREPLLRLLALRFGVERLFVDFERLLLLEALPFERAFVLLDRLDVLLAREPFDDARRELLELFEREDPVFVWAIVGLLTRSPSLAPSPLSREGLSTRRVQIKPATPLSIQSETVA